MSSENGCTPESERDNNPLQFKQVGEVSEWLKEHASKACEPVRVPRVRISPSPPF